MKKSAMPQGVHPETVREEVRARYAAHALRVVEDAKGGCCGGSGPDPISRNLYDPAQTCEVPDAALAASLGCGNPTALAALRPGETVLDLGSGGGIDVLLSAKRVGQKGFVYGLDMTDEMLALAEKNRASAGAANVKFLKGHIESIPLPDAAVDVVVSNCVINLSPDKARVLAEAFRVLRPGGRFAVSDVVLEGEFPAEILRDIESWAGCVAGALEEGEYRGLLAEAGFEDIGVEVTRVHDAGKISGSSCCGTEGACGTAAIVPTSATTGRIVSAFVRATKPAAVHMPKLEIFDPPLCCSTGVCGPSVDPVLLKFAGSLAWLRRQGVIIERRNLAQEPEAFAACAAVKQLLDERGEKALPVTIVDGRVIAVGAYPTKQELAAATGVKLATIAMALIPDGGPCV